MHKSKIAKSLIKSERHAKLTNQHKVQSSTVGDEGSYNTTYQSQYKNMMCGRCIVVVR